MKKLLRKVQHPLYIAVAVALCVYSAVRGFSALSKGSGHFAGQFGYWLELALCLAVFVYAANAAVSLSRSAYMSYKNEL